MKPLPLNRLAALENLLLRERPIYSLWVDDGDTDADVEERRHRLIADGRASAVDRFYSCPVGNDPRLPWFPRFVLYFQERGARDGSNANISGLRRQLLAPLFMNASSAATCVLSPSKSCAICS